MSASGSFHLFSDVEVKSDLNRLLLMMRSGRARRLLAAVLQLQAVIQAL